MAAELADVARSVLDTYRYMALGTAAAAGHLWVSPVWVASEDDRTFPWGSSPDARHSRNLAARPAVAIASLDSWVPVGGAQAVSRKGVAGQLTGADLDQGLEVLTACGPTGPRSRRWAGGCAGIGTVAALSRDGLRALGADPGPGSRSWLGVDRSQRVSLD